MINNVKFPELAKAMASKGVSKKTLAKNIGLSPASVTLKMSGKVDFRITEMKKTVDFFNGMGATVTLDSIFYTQ